MVEYVNRIKFYREQKNMTQQEIADLMKVNVRNIKRWENGETAVDVLHAIEISKILGVSVEEIFDV